MTLLPPWELAEYAQRVYSEPEPHFSHRYTTRRRSGAIVFRDCAAHVYEHPVEWTRGKTGTVPVIAFRGTIPTDLENWVRDLKQWPLFSDLGIGPAGFTEGADGLFDDCLNKEHGISKRGMPLLGRSPVLTGHSLGGALAMRFAGLVIASGFSAPRQVAVFNSPIPGGRKLRRLLRKSPTAHYRHAGDVVSRVERLFGLYVQPCAPIDVGKFLPPLEAHAIGNFTKKELYPCIAPSLVAVSSA